MRMNQQYQQRQNGFVAKHKHNKGGDGEQQQQQGSNNRQQRHQHQPPKPEFKPVAILKRGDPPGAAILNKDESQSKENINATSYSRVVANTADGQQPKSTTTNKENATTIQRPTIPQSAPQPVILSSSKAPANSSPPVSVIPSPSSSTPVASTLAVPTTAPIVVPAIPSLSNVVHRPAGPIVLTRSSSGTVPPPLSTIQRDQHIQSITSRLFSSSSTMKSSLKLIDESLTWCENGQLSSYLQESDGFVVVGAIGREKVGKSTLLSLLGGNQFTDEDRLMIFPAASSSSHKVTRGIDVYVTNEQTILLDTQPLLSSSLHQQQLMQPSHHYQQQQQQRTASTSAMPPAPPAPHLWQQQIDPRSMYVDNVLELHTLELIAFILAVCHVVLVVEDQFADPYFYRLLQLAEILRPVLKRNSQEMTTAHSPHIVFVLNKCDGYIAPQERSLIKRALANMMIDTRFQVQASLETTHKIRVRTNLKQITNGWRQEQNDNLLIKLSQRANKKSESDDEDDEDKVFDATNNNTKEKETNFDNVNAVFIPRRDFRESLSHSSHWQSRFVGFSNADSIVRQLRQQLLAIDRPHIEQCPTQRAWLTHAARIWDLIAKSSQLADFSRLLT